MEDYDNREFDTSDDPGDFSSYGYLVGLLRSFDHAVYRLARSSEANVKEVCNNTDTCIAAWVSLLSQGKRKLFREDGTFDELLFKGHTLLHVYVPSLMLPMRVVVGAHSTVSSLPVNFARFGSFPFVLSLTNVQIYRRCAQATVHVDIQPD